MGLTLVAEDAVRKMLLCFSWMKFGEVAKRLQSPTVKRHMHTCRHTQ